MTAPDDPDDGPWIAHVLSRVRAYHTDRECTQLARSPRDPREVTWAAVEWHDLDECDDCAGLDTHGSSNTGCVPQAVRDRGDLG